MNKLEDTTVLDLENLTITIPVISISATLLSFF